MLDLRNKAILVTGGAGFLGAHVIAVLKGRGVPDSRLIVPHAADRDLRRKDVCEEITKGVDAVIHLAGVSGDGEFHRDHSAEVFFDNLMMGVELLEAARANGVQKVVIAGSIIEYPEHAPMPLKEKDLWSGPVEELHEAYAVAKTMLLAQAQAYRAQYGFDAAHLIATNMYGPGKEAGRGFVIANIIQKIWEAKRAASTVITLLGTGAPTRDFLFVRDAAEAFVLALERYSKPEPVNIGSGSEVSVRALAETIARLMDYRGEIRWDASKPDGAPRRQLDVSHAERELGFRAQTSLEQGLKETIAWHEKHLLP